MQSFCIIVAFLTFISPYAVFSKPVSEASLFRFANIYGDHMVLQQAPFRANVWGYGEVGQTVTVVIGNIAYQAKIGKGGDFHSFSSLFVYHASEFGYCFHN